MLSLRERIMDSKPWGIIISFTIATLTLTVLAVAGFLFSQHCAVGRNCTQGMEDECPPPWG